MNIDALQRLLRPLTRRVSTMVSRVVLRQVDDGHGRQEAQVEGFAAELHQRVEHFQPFGIRANPPIGSEGIGIAVGGSRNHLLVVGLSDKEAPRRELAEGDVLFYCSDDGVFAHLKKSGELQVRGRSEVKLELESLETKQFVKMKPNEFVFQVEKADDATKVSRVTITPTSVVIETENFIHP